MGFGTVYRVFNTETGKSYVGQTWNTLEKRMIGHCRPGRMLIQRAIQKYGNDAFIVSTLATCTSQNELDTLEDKFILELNTLHPNGYNLRRGGARGKHTIESRRKMSEAHKGQHSSPSSEFRKGMVPWNKGGGTYSLESRQKMRRAKLGTHRSEATKQKISASMIIARQRKKLGKRT